MSYLDEEETYEDVKRLRKEIFRLQRVIDEQEDTISKMAADNLIMCNEITAFSEFLKRSMSSDSPGLSIRENAEITYNKAVEDYRESVKRFKESGIKFLDAHLVEDFILQMDVESK